MADSEKFYPHLSPDRIDFDTDAVVADRVGRLKWNDTDGTLDLGLKGGNVNLQIGQETVQRVYNSTASTIPNGSVVRMNGSQGSQRITVELAQADTEAHATDILGVATEDILSHEEGFVTVRGLVRHFDTSAFDEGANVYLSPTVAGGLTKTKPVAPYPVVDIGFVARKNASTGILYVHSLDKGLISGLTANRVPIAAGETRLTDNAALTFDAGTGTLSATKFAGDGSSLTGISSSPGVNVETLSAGKTLTPGVDAEYQFLNPNGSRTLTIANGTTAGQRFVILNTSTNSSQTLSYAGAAFGTQYPFSVWEIIWDGSAWKGVGGIGSRATGGGGAGFFAWGANARAANGSMAFGDNSNASSVSATAFGPFTDAGQVSCVYGSSAKSGEYGASLGASSGSTSISYATSLGSNSIPVRHAEVVESIDHASPQKYSRSRVGFLKESTDATPTEVFIRGVASNRLTVIASSAFMFDINAIAYNNAGTEGATWRISGGIRRDGANNTTLIGAVTKTMVSNDAGAAAWDITVTADDTNESLKIEVTGENAKTIRWAIDAKLTEARF